MINMERVHAQELDPINQLLGRSMTQPMLVVNDQKGQQMI